MSTVAAFPMYDWPEVRAEVDAAWAAIRDRLRAAGIDAPERLARRNADLPAVPGGIRDAGGRIIAPDPAGLPPDGFDLHTLWRHPALLVCQTCWGPMEAGLAPHVRVIGQPDYSPYEGGGGALYSSAIVMRRVDTPSSGTLIDLLRGARFAFNSRDSRSGCLALGEDLDAAGEGLAIFSALVETGGHRASIRAVAEGRADVAAIDCRSWAMALRHEPAARTLRVAGWTGRRKGLPYIQAPAMPHVEPGLLAVLD